MAFLGWNNAFNVSIEEMDRQQKNFFETFNRMIEAVQRADKEEALERIFVELAEYTSRHIKDEETLLKKVNYPELHLHRQQHNIFISHLNGLMCCYCRKHLTIPESTLVFTKNWLQDHILQQDKKFGTYLSKKSLL